MAKRYTAQGTATAHTFSLALSPPSGYQWELSHIGINTTSTTSSAANAYINSHLLCGSSAGNNDAASGLVPVYDADQLIITWTNLSIGAVCNVQIVVDEKTRGT